MVVDKLYTYKELLSFMDNNSRGGQWKFEDEYYNNCFLCLALDYLFEHGKVKFDVMYEIRAEINEELKGKSSFNLMVKDWFNCSNKESAGKANQLRKEFLKRKIKELE